MSLSIRAKNAALRVVLPWASKPPVANVLCLIAIILNRPVGLTFTNNVSDHWGVDLIQCFLNNPQGKIVQVLSGEVFDVAVDLRKSSSSFGWWVATTLSAANRLQHWIPPGFADGFLVTSASADVFYKTTGYYAPQYERTIHWHDAAIGVQWPLQVQPVLSAKDLQAGSLKNTELFD